MAVQPGQRQRVLVVDSFPISRRAVADLLRHSGVAHDTYEAGSATTALKQARAHALDLVVLDPDIDGPQAGLGLCRKLKDSARPPAVLVFASVSTPSVITASVVSGADGFVHRSATLEQLVDVAQSIREGRPFRFLAEPAPARRRSPQRMTGPYNEMTRREEQVFALLLDRYSNDEIAAELHLAPQTVKNHVSTILRKTGVGNRRELAMLQRKESRESPDSRVDHRGRARRPDARLGATQP